ncbi:MAG: hypothetical protein ABL921_20700, partial [Pirellula sp.]
DVASPGLMIELALGVGQRVQALCAVHGRTRQLRPTLASPTSPTVPSARSCRWPDRDIHFTFSDGEGVPCARKADFACGFDRELSTISVLLLRRIVGIVNYFGIDELN